MGELAKIDSFKREVAIVETIEEVKLLTTKGELLAEMARKLEIPLKGQNELGLTRLDLEKKKRELIEQMFPKGAKPGTNNREIVNSQNGSLQNTGISWKESSDAKTIKEEDELVNEVVEEIIKENDVITPKKVASKVRKKKRKKKIEEVKKKIEQENLIITNLYDVIAIDPPWKYGREYDPEGSRVASPYPEMSFDELCNIEIPAKDNCVMWLWTTHQFIWEARELLRIWGFEYKAILVWDKEQMGMGHWLRMQCEFCLLGIKGNPIWDIKDLRDIIRSKRREHSRKPPEFYEMIEKNFTGRFTDYFSREKFSNKWDCYGAETGKF